MNRVLLAVVILIGVQAAAWWISKGRKPESVRMPNQSLSSLPTSLGPWKGRDESMDPRLNAAVGAADVVNRVYEDDSAIKIAAQVSAFPSIDGTLPHDPRNCYGQVGWKIVDRKTINLRVDADTSRPAQLMILEQERHRIVIVFWYQFGDVNVTDSEGLRRARWAHFGQKIWPPVIKVLLQIDGPEAIQPEKSIRAFADLLFSWTREV
jgi:EpsI family protein